MLALDLAAVETELYESYMKPVCQEFSLTSMELSILLFLANNPEYDTARDLVKIRHLTKSYVSMAVNSLETKGYLHKEYRDGDHKTIHLILQPGCRKIIQKGKKVQKKFVQVMTDGFSKEELDTLNSYLRRIHENMADALNDNRKSNRNGK